MQYTIVLNTIKLLLVKYFQNERDMKKGNVKDCPRSGPKFISIDEKSANILQSFIKISNHPLENYKKRNQPTISILTLKKKKQFSSI